MFFCMLLIKHVNVEEMWSHLLEESQPSKKSMEIFVKMFYWHLGDGVANFSRKA